MVQGIANQPRVTSAFRLLLWLKWTLMWRGVGRDRMRLFGTIALLVLCTPVSVGLAVVCWLLVVHAPPIAPVVVRAAFGFAYLLWLFTPLLGFPLNESYDPTRLFVYPVSYRTIFLAAVVGGCFDLSTLLILPVFLALLIALSPNLFAALASFVLIALFLLQAIATAQAVMLALIGFLRSRRFRDITMVLLPLVGAAWYILQQTAVRHFTLFTTAFRNIVESPLWSALGWLPPGWAASGMIAARHGQFGLAIVYMALLAVVCAAMAFVSAFVMRQLYLGDRGPAMKPSPNLQPFPHSAGERREEARSRVLASSSASPVLTGYGAREWGLFPPALSAVMQKEWRYLWREPQYKVVAINMLTTLLLFGVMFLFNPAFRSTYGAGEPFSPAGMPTGAGAMLLQSLLSFRILGITLFAGVTLLFNIFGGEGPAITMLFSFPTPRRDLILGKNLVHAAIVFAICALGIVGGSYVTHTLALMPLMFVEAVVCLPVVIAAGNLISIRFPHRMVVRGQRWGRSNQVTLGSAGAGTGSGCGYAFVYLGCYMATFAALIPAVAAVVAPAAFDLGPLWEALGIVGALVYAFGIYFAGLYVASTWLMTRETAIIERLAPGE